MAILEASRAQLHLIQGDIEAANCWAQTCKSAENEQNVLPHLKELSILARVYLATHKFEEALRLLARLLQAVEKAQHVEDLITLFLLQALAFSAQGNSDQAITSLAKALSIAEPGGYIRIFVNEGRPMAALLERFLVAQQKRRPFITKNISQRYVSQLLAGMPMTLLAQTEKPSQRKTASLLVPLSDREIAVLRLIALGLSDGEIARQLVLAVGTIKTHAKRIYAKLGVNNRTQAVLRAKDLHLL